MNLGFLICLNLTTTEMQTHMDLETQHLCNDEHDCLML